MLFSQAKFNLRVFRALSTLGSEAISSFSSDFVTHLIMAANHCLRDTGISLHRSLIFLAYYLYLLDLQLTSRQKFARDTQGRVVSPLLPLFPSAVFKDFFFSIPGSYLEALVKRYGHQTLKNNFLSGNNNVQAFYSIVSKNCQRFPSLWLMLKNWFHKF